MERGNNGSVFIWFVCGALLGAATALLMAPQTGAKTRKQLANQAERGRKNLLESSQEFFEKGREMYERGREIAESAAEIFERGRRIAEKTIEDRI